MGTANNKLLNIEQIAFINNLINVDSCTKRYLIISEILTSLLSVSKILTHKVETVFKNILKWQFFTLRKRKNLSPYFSLKMGKIVNSDRFYS